MECDTDTPKTVDGDISGPGVRVSFYLQAFCLVLLVDRSWEDAPVALWTFIAMSFGLTLAATINRQTIVLLEALQVSNLVWLANFGTFIALASYSRQKAASKKLSKRIKYDYGVKFGAMLQTLFSMTLTIYLWVRVDRFWSQDPVYVFFVFKAPALQSGRVISLTFASILTALYILVTLHELLSYFRSRQRTKEKALKVEKDCEAAISSPTSNIPPALIVVHSPHDIATPTSEVLSSPKIAKASSTTSSHTRFTVSTPTSATSAVFPPKRRRPDRRRWSSSDLDPMLVGIIICQILVFTYFIVSSELLLKYNDADVGSSFGFGQILALVFILPSILAVVGALREHGFKRKSKKRSKSRRRRSRRADR